MLHKVIIRSNKTDSECEELINSAVAEYPNYEVFFDMLIESTFTVLNSNQQTLYTLMIRIEEAE